MVKGEWKSTLLSDTQVHKDLWGGGGGAGPVV